MFDEVKVDFKQLLLSLCCCGKTHWMRYFNHCCAASLFYYEQWGSSVVEFVLHSRQTRKCNQRETMLELRTWKKSFEELTNLIELKKKEVCQTFLLLTLFSLNKSRSSCVETRSFLFYYWFT
jgi:hypothetical protein